MRRVVVCALALTGLVCAAGGGSAAAERSGATRAAGGAPPRSCAAKRAPARRMDRCRARVKRRALVGHVRRAALAAPAAWTAAGGFMRAAVAGSGTPTSPARPSPGGTAAPQPTPSPAPAPTADPGPPPPPPPPVPEDDPHSVKVSATEFALTLSQAGVAAGDVRVEFDNSRAEDPHDLVLDPESGGESFSFGRLEPGEVSARMLALSAGTYRLWCSLLDHEVRGMTARLEVS